MTVNQRVVGSSPTWGAKQISRQSTDGNLQPAIHSNLLKNAKYNKISLKF